MCCNTDYELYGKDYITCDDHKDPGDCGRFDKEKFKAADLCCICGGGKTCEGEYFSQFVIPINNRIDYF